jgi:hypothetical protein
MDDVRPSKTSAGKRSSELAGPLGDARRRAREFFADQEGILDNLEATLQEQLELVGEQLVRQPAGVNPAGDECDGRREENARLTAELASLTDELAQREAQLEADRAQVDAAQELLELSRLKIEAQRELREHELDAAQAALDAERQVLVADQLLFTSQRQTIEADRARSTADQLAARQLADELARDQASVEAARQAVQAERARLIAEREQVAADRAAVAIEQEQAASTQSQTSRARERLEAEQRRLDADLDRLAADQAAASIAGEEAEAARQQAARLRERVEEDRKQLDALRTKLVAERAVIQTVQEEADAARAEFSRARERLETERQQIVAERDRLSDLEAETKNQRRRIAREFQVQRATHVAELERRKTELETLGESSQSELAIKLAEAQAEGQGLREQSAHLRKLLNARAEELTELRGQATHLCNELESLRHQHDRLTQELAIQGTVEAAEGEEAARLRIECERLTKKLAAVEEQAASRDLSEEQQTKVYEMQRRFEMAVEDARDYKKRNAELELRLAKAQAGGGSAVIAGGGLDWESQKRRLLASLEADDDAQDEERREERLTIESTISITDEVVADKDREIRELKQLLEDQSSNLGSVAVGASAIAAILDQDELIRHEREQLERLQTELQAKLRQAEIDISLERATIARERAQINEKLASHQANVADRQAAEESAADTSKPGKPVRGRWLARLGLKELEE